MLLFGIEHTDEKCPQCLSLVSMEHEEIRLETILPVPAKPRAPMSRTMKKTHICFDCAAAEGAMRSIGGMDFAMARIAVGNDRQEQLRMPGFPMGLVLYGIMRPSQPGDFETLLDWHDRMGLTDQVRDQVRQDAALEKLEVPFK